MTVHTLPSLRTCASAGRGWRTTPKRMARRYCECSISGKGVTTLPVALIEVHIYTSSARSVRVIGEDAAATRTAGTPPDGPSHRHKLQRTRRTRQEGHERAWRAEFRHAERITRSSQYFAKLARDEHVRSQNICKVGRTLACNKYTAAYNVRAGHA